MKTTKLKVGQTLTAKRAAFLRIGDELAYTYTGTPKERWFVETIVGKRVSFRRTSGASRLSPVVYNVDCSGGWKRLTVTKLAKGVSVRTHHKLSASGAYMAERRLMHAQETCRTLIKQKADLRNELETLKDMLAKMVTASDESLDAAKRRHDVWTEVRKHIGMPRLTAWQKARGY